MIRRESFNFHQDKFIYHFLFSKVYPEWVAINIYSLSGSILQYYYLSYTEEGLTDWQGREFMNQKVSDTFRRHLKLKVFA
jgi:hypothetical protein